MQIGAVGYQAYQPYIYNTNQVSSNSLSRVKPIGDDLLSSKTDFSGLTEDNQQTLNPLRRGETANFADVIAMQMQMGSMNASRLLTTAREAGAEMAEPGDRQTSQNADAGFYQRQQAAMAYRVNMLA